MTAVHRRAARREQQLADSLGTTRKKYRGRFERAPDAAPVRLPSGYVIQPESKSRVKLPKWIVDAVAKTETYTPRAIALVGLYQKGSSEALAVMRLRDLLLLLGLEAPRAGEQLTLARSID